MSGAQPLNTRFLCLQGGASAHMAQNAAFAAGKRLLLHRLSRLKEPSPQEVDILDGIVSRRKQCPQGDVLLGEDAASNRPRFLLNGWACRQLILKDGRRQIFGFLVPGDILAPDYESFLLGNIVALTPVSTSDLPQFGGASVRYDDGALFSLALSSAKRERERLLHQQVLRLGGMNARERTAHLLLELSERLGIVGLSDGHKLPFPLTQETLGDALGMSAVHANRTLQQLRRDKVIEYVSRDLLRIDTQKLAALAQPSTRDV